MKSTQLTLHIFIENSEYSLSNSVFKKFSGKFSWKVNKIIFLYKRAYKQLQAGLHINKNKSVIPDHSKLMGTVVNRSCHSTNGVHIKSCVKVFLKTKKIVKVNFSG